MLKLNSILLFSENPSALSDFYKMVFEKDPDWVMEGYYGYVTEGAALTIGPHDKVHGKNSNPERIMLNLESENVPEEFKRIKEAGGTVIAQPYNPDENDKEIFLSTLADPDGNYIQIVSPWKD